MNNTTVCHDRLPLGQGRRTAPTRQGENTTLTVLPLSMWSCQWLQLQVQWPFIFFYLCVCVNISYNFFTMGSKNSYVQVTFSCCSR